MSESRCIEHNQKGNKHGYGKGVFEGKCMLLHRITYCFTHRVPPEYIEGSVIRHTCDNPRCINPQHLLLGTQQDNVQDRVYRERCANNKGTVNPNSKLLVEDVLRIRELYIKGSTEFGSYALARMYKVSAVQIQHIIKRKSWSHI